MGWVRLSAALTALTTGLCVAACNAAPRSENGHNHGGTGPSAGSGADQGQGGIDLGSGSGSGGGLGEEGCAEAVAEPTLVPVAMFIAVDKSGSMGGDKWDDAKAAFISFFTDPSADPLEVALRFWPEGNCDEDSCSIQACSQPQIALGALSDPAHEAALVALFNATDPGGNTPTSAALAGATQWAIAQQAVSEGAAKRYVVVLVTDGDPNGCQEDITTISNIAGSAYTDHDILSFAVGLQGSNEADMDTIAAAGGTQTGFFIGSGNAQAELLAALQAIQQTAVACTFAMPESTDPNKTIDPDKINVTYTPSGGSETTVKQVAGEADCGPDGGWYYDDPVAPSIIQLCESTCNAVQSDAGTLHIVLGCETIVN